MITVHRICLAVLLCLCCAAAQAAQPAGRRARPDAKPDQAKAVEEWLMSYYQSPTPHRFVKQVRAMSRLGFWQEKKAGYPTLMFMSEVIRDNPKQAARWCKALASLPEDQHGYLGWAFNNAAVPASRRCIAKTLRLSAADLQIFKKTRRYDPVDYVPEEALELDMLWAAFFATGKPRLIHRLIDVLAQPGEKNPPLAAAAEWSLAANAPWHPPVLEALKTRRHSARGELRKTLDKILSKARSAMSPRAEPQRAR